MICSASIGVFVNYFKVESVLANLWRNEVGIIYLTPLMFLEFLYNKDWIHKFPMRKGLLMILINGVLAAVGNWAFVESTKFAELS